MDYDSVSCQPYNSKRRSYDIFPSTVVTIRNLLIIMIFVSLGRNLEKEINICVQYYMENNQSYVNEVKVGISCEYSSKSNSLVIFHIQINRSSIEKYVDMLSVLLSIEIYEEELNAINH